MASEPPKVFISYNRADRDWAEWIAGVIERGGYQPIIQAWDFRPGEDFVLKMQQAATESDLTIAVLSEAYLKAEFTQPEWTAAFARDPTGEKRGLIPIRVAECSLTGMLLPRININLVGLKEQDAERALLDGLKPSGKPAQAPPFPGKQAEPSISTTPFPPNNRKTPRRPRSAAALSSARGGSRRTETKIAHRRFPAGYHRPILGPVPRT